MPGQIPPVDIKPTSYTPPTGEVESTSIKEGRKWLPMGPKTTMAAKASLIGASLIATLLAPQAILLTGAVIFLTAKSLHTDVKNYRAAAEKADLIARGVFKDDKAATFGLFPVENKRKNERPESHTLKVHIKSDPPVKMALNVSDKELTNLISIDPKYFGRSQPFVENKDHNLIDQQVFFAETYAMNILSRCDHDVDLAEAVIKKLAERENVQFKITRDEYPFLIIQSDQGRTLYSKDDLLNPPEELPPASDADIEDAETEYGEMPPLPEETVLETGTLRRQADETSSQSVSNQSSGSSINFPQSVDSEEDISSGDFSVSLDLKGESELFELDRNQVSNLSKIPPKVFSNPFPDTFESRTIEKARTLQDDAKVRFYLTRLAAKVNEDADALETIVEGLADLPNTEWIDEINIYGTTDYNIEVRWLSGESQVMVYDSYSNELRNS